MDLCTKMMQERKQLEAVLENADLKSKEAAIHFADALTKIIWNHNMLGLVYEYYDENVVYKGAAGARVTGPNAVLNKYLEMQAAFPDLRVIIQESFAREDSDNGFVVYQRSYALGTNKGTSKYGPPTGNKLNEDNSMGQTVYHLRNLKGHWKVVEEYSLRSESAIEELLKSGTLQ